MKKHRTETSRPALALRDQLAGHCEKIELVAGLLAACRPCGIPAALEPELAARAGHFIRREIHALDETLEKLYKHLRKA